jgi:OmcA/MtrC family decaheme c-type cytochrome
VTDSSVAAGLAPTWTLAGLSVDPVTVGLTADPTSPSGFVRPPVPAWQSYLLTGSGQLKSLPIDGPGTPDAFVLRNSHQPGSETGGQLQALGEGKYTYTFQSALPANFDMTQTLRVGVWLQGAAGTSETSSTFDFAAGGAVQSRELVLDANCNKCHGLLQAHGGVRTGVKLCVTCHTYQNADPNTVDPAAITGATPDTNPNPLDMGRLIHRIHRGKNLPTLYQANAAQPAGSRANVSLPFFPGRNMPVVGQKYSIVGFQQSETVFGQVVNRTDHGQPAMAVATGVGFPHDLRDC